MGANGDAAQRKVWVTSVPEGASVFRQQDGRPRIEWLDVTITRSQPGVRDYSGGKEE